MSKSAISSFDYSKGLRSILCLAQEIYHKKSSSPAYFSCYWAEKVRIEEQEDTIEESMQLLLGSSGE
jgi:hypothetical protein